MWGDFEVSESENGYILNRYHGSAQTIHIPRSLVEVSPGKFCDPSQTSLEGGVAKYIEEIGEYCFNECGTLWEITFEEGSHIRKIGECAFSATGLMNVTIPKSVEEISDCAFYGTLQLSQVTFEEGSQIRKMGDSAFAASGIKSMVILKSVEEIEKECFWESDLSAVTFEEGSNLKKIGDRAFYAHVTSFSLSNGDKQHLVELLTKSGLYFDDDDKVINII